MLMRYTQDRQLTVAELGEHPSRGNTCDKAHMKESLKRRKQIELG